MLDSLLNQVSCMQAMSMFSLLRTCKIRCILLHRDCTFQERSRNTLTSSRLSMVSLGSRNQSHVRASSAAPCRQDSCARMWNDLDDHARQAYSCYTRRLLWVQISWDSPLSCVLFLCNIHIPECRELDICLYNVRSTDIGCTDERRNGPPPCVPVYPCVSYFDGWQ